MVYVPYAVGIQTADNIATAVRAMTPASLVATPTVPATNSFSVFLRDTGYPATPDSALLFAFALKAALVDPTRYSYQKFGPAPNAGESESIWMTVTYDQDVNTVGQIEGHRAFGVNDNLTRTFYVKTNARLVVGRTAEIVGNINVNQLSVFNGIFEHAHEWLLTLVICQQVKALRPENVQAFLQGAAGMTFNTGALMPIIAYVAARIPRLLDNVNIQAAIAENAFLKNHTAYAAVGALGVLFNLSFPSVYENAISVAQRGHLALAASHPWEPAHAIAVTQRTRALIAVGLTVVGQCPNGWRQGNAAMNATPGVVVRRWTSAFKRLTVLGGADLENGNEADCLAAIGVGE